MARDSTSHYGLLVSVESSTTKETFDAEFLEQAFSGEPPSGMTARQADFYQKLRVRIRTWLLKVGPGFKYADILMVAPDMFHLLCKLVADKRVPPGQKAKLAATLAYFIIPIGIVPEALVGPIGYVDDVALTAYVLSRMLNSDQADIVREHWAGDGDVLQVVQGILEVAENAIGTGLWKNLKGIRLPKVRR